MAAGSTYTPIATQTLGSAASSVTFSSIPSTYTDLVLIISAQTSTGSNGYDIRGQFNGDTGTNYSHTQMFGNGSSASSSRESNVAYMKFGLTDTSNFTVARVNIMNYSNTTTYKTVITRRDDASQYTIEVVDLWRNTAAITSIYIYPETASNFTAGSTFTLYGIAAA
jgi:hypothetical protein